MSSVSSVLILSIVFDESADREADAEETSHRFEAEAHPFRGRGSRQWSNKPPTVEVRQPPVTTNIDRSDGQNGRLGCCTTGTSFDKGTRRGRTASDVKIASWGEGASSPSKHPRPSVETCTTGPTNRGRLRYLRRFFEDIPATSRRETHSPWVGSPVRRPEKPHR